MHLIELIANNTLTALDLETSGLDRKKDRIIEIGAVKICGWEKSEDGAPKKVKLGETFSTFVSFPGTLPEEILQLTGITEQDLEHAPKIKAALKKLKNLSETISLSGIIVSSTTLFFIPGAGNAGSRLTTEGWTPSRSPDPFTGIK